MFHQVCYRQIFFKSSSVSLKSGKILNRLENVSETMCYITLKKFNATDFSLTPHVNEDAIFLSTSLGQVFSPRPIQSNLLESGLEIRSLIISKTYPCYYHHCFGIQSNPLESGLDILYQKHTNMIFLKTLQWSC